MSQVLFTYIAGLFRTLRFLGMVVLVVALVVVKVVLVRVMVANDSLISNV